MQVQTQKLNVFHFSGSKEEENVVGRQSLKLTLSQEFSWDCGASWSMPATSRQNGLQAMASNAKHHLLATLTNLSVIQLREVASLKVLKSLDLSMGDIGLECRAITWVRFQEKAYIAALSQDGNCLNLLKVKMEKNEVLEFSSQNSMKLEKCFDDVTSPSHDEENEYFMLGNNFSLVVLLTG